MADPVDRSGFSALLRQHRLAAGLTQAALAERAGLAERTVQDLERAVARPLRETVRRLVAALEPTPEARARFEAAISAPRRQPGPTPRPQRRDVPPRVQDEVGDVPAIVSLDARPSNLPLQTTPLLGRDQEVRSVTSLLLRDDPSASPSRAGIISPTTAPLRGTAAATPTSGQARLVTLTGPGGTGKTRLGLQVAAEVLDRFEDGAYFVELAPIGDPGLVPSAIAEALGLRDMGGHPALERLKAYLRSRSTLLLLDNFEQILPAAPVVADLLASSHGLKVLVTSREPLRLRGEHEYAVPPLALPDVRAPATPSSISQYAAVALFLARAVAIRADFAVTVENASAVAEICTRLDGLPLAIELAAARVRLLTPQAMVGRLERRLPLLTGGARDLPARQQTLRDTIAWSHDLLDDPERRLFRRLSVFVGGWTLEAAEAVCNPDGDVDVLGGLESLVAKNLVRRDDTGHGDVRFRMLETIREYADEQSRRAANRKCYGAGTRPVASISRQRPAASIR